MAEKKAKVESTVDPTETKKTPAAAKKTTKAAAKAKDTEKAGEKKAPAAKKTKETKAAKEEPAAKAKKTSTKEKASEADTLLKKQIVGMKYDEKAQVYGALDQSKDKIFRTKDAKAKQAGDWIKEEFQIISSNISPKKDRLVRVKITGRTMDEDYGSCMVARLCDKDASIDKNRGYFRILIPINFFVDLTDEEEMWDVPDKATAERYKNAIIDRFLDIKVDVVLFKVNEFERVALASRLDASQWLSKKYFKGGSTYETRAYFHEGDVATGQVMAAMRDRLIVSVYGQDMVIRSNETSWLANEALYDEFSVGQMVDVKLLSIDNDYEKEVMGKKYKLTKIVGSIKQASMNPNQLFFGDYKEGDLYSCRVKARAKNKVYVTVNDQILVMCDDIPSGRIRDEARVRITKKEIVKDKNTGEKVFRFYGNLINKDF